LVRWRGSVRTDQNEEPTFFDDLTVMKKSLQFRRTQNYNESDELKLMIVDGLLSPMNQTARRNFFINDIEPQLRKKKRELLQPTRYK